MSIALGSKELTKPSINEEGSDDDNQEQLETEL